MDNNAVGSFASGLANGLGLGMKYGNMQGGQKELPQAQQAQQQAPAPQQQVPQQAGGMGLPTSYTGYAPQQAQQQPVQQAPAASSTQGNGPWSFISSLFSGAGNNG